MGDLDFPTDQWFFLALDNDAACTSLSGHSVRKCAVLVLVWCYNATGDREQDVVKVLTAWTLH